MPTASRLPVRPEPLAIAFALYAASTLTSMAVMSLGAAVLGVALLFSLGGPRGWLAELKAAWKAPASRLYLQASVSLLAACALSTLVAMRAPLGWGGRFVQPAVSDLAKSWYFVWPVLLLGGLRRLGPSGRRLALRSWLITFAAVSFIGVIQHFTGWPRAQAIPSNPGRFHATLFLGHHLSVASILIFPFFAALDLLKRSLSEGEAGASGRVLSARALLACLGLGFAALFLSYSRMLWAALPLGMALWAARAFPWRRALVAIALVATACVLALQIPAIRVRAWDAIGIGDRQALWKANFEFLKARPLTGAGFRRNIEASSYYLESLPNNGWVFSGHAHNNLIDMLGGTGLLGAIAWLIWCGMVFALLKRASAKGAAPDRFVWGLVCAWVVFQVNGLTQVNFWEGKVMHQMMWAVAWSLFWASEPEERALA